MSTNLDAASSRLFRRPKDERYETLEELMADCRKAALEAAEMAVPLSAMARQIKVQDELRLATGAGWYRFVHWSFSQLCRLVGMPPEPLNRLTPELTQRVLTELLIKRSVEEPGEGLQVLKAGDRVRAVTSTAYARLYDVTVMEVLMETLAARGFRPPQVGFNGATGLYRGEQDMFVFLVDPAGFVEISGEMFAPGVFVWNSEVGRRSVGIKTFWFQAVCQNHIVWDAKEVTTFRTRHVGKVDRVKGLLEATATHLVAVRDRRRDEFVKRVQAAQATPLTSDEATLARLYDLVGQKSLVNAAIKSLGETGRPLTLWNLVDELTRESQRRAGDYAGDRVELDQRIGTVLA